MTDDLPFDYPSEPTVNVSTKRCRRHVWGLRCRLDGHWNGCLDHFHIGPDVEDTACRRCGKVRDETVTRRNKNNRQRGSTFERTVAKRLGGRRTGPLGGRDDVMGDDWVAQTKRTAEFSISESQVYLRDLLGTYPDRVPLVVHGLPGKSSGVLVISRYGIYADRWGTPRSTARVWRPLSVAAARTLLRHVDAVIWYPEQGNDALIILDLEDWGRTPRGGRTGAAGGGRCLGSCGTGPSWPTLRGRTTESRALAGSVPPPTTTRR